MPEVLIVDDDPDVRSLLVFTLVDAGFEVREARDGAHALDALRERAPDCMLLDLMMPGLDATMRDPAMGAELPCRVEALDVDDDASVAALFAQLGPVDVLVNNAGVVGPGSCEEAPLELVRGVFETNFFGAVRCTRAVLP